MMIRANKAPREKERYSNDECYKPMPNPFAEDALPSEVPTASSPPAKGAGEASLGDRDVSHDGGASAADRSSNEDA